MSGSAIGKRSLRWRVGEERNMNCYVNIGHLLEYLRDCRKNQRISTTMDVALLNVVKKPEERKQEYDNEDL